MVGRSLIVWVVVVVGACSGSSSPGAPASDAAGGNDAGSGGEDAAGTASVAGDPGAGGDETMRGGSSPMQSGNAGVGGTGQGGTAQGGSAQGGTGQGGVANGGAAGSAVAGSGTEGGAGGADGDTFTDPRDGEVYKVVLMQVPFGQGPPQRYLWLGENLRWQAPLGFSHCADGVAANCKAFGRFYDQIAALNGDSSAASVVRGACPEGWHLPNESELQFMADFLGANQQFANYLKSTSGWATTQGIDRFGFNGEPLGYYSEDLLDTDRHGIGTWSLYWTSAASIAFGLVDKPPASLFYVWDRHAQFTLRCVKQP